MVFKETTGGPGNNVAKWDGQNWSRLGDGIEPNSGVGTIVFQGDTLNMAGWFGYANNQRSPVFARYYNGVWCNNKDSTIGSAQKLVVFDNKVVMGGAFWVTNTTPLPRLQCFLATMIALSRYKSQEQHQNIC